MRNPLYNSLHLSQEHSRTWTLALDMFLPEQPGLSLQKPRICPFKPLTKNQKRKPHSSNLESESQTLNPNRGTLNFSWSLPQSFIINQPRSLTNQNLIHLITTTGSSSLDHISSSCCNINNLRIRVVLSSLCIRDNFLLIQQQMMDPSLVKQCVLMDGSDKLVNQGLDWYANKGHWSQGFTCNLTNIKGSLGN